MHEEVSIPLTSRVELADRDQSLRAARAERVLNMAVDVMRKT